MEKLFFDNGIKEYKINESGVLRFNPSDPNVYARFMEAVPKLEAVEETMVEKAQAIQGEPETNGEAVLQLLTDADKEVKKILSWVFGESNDFDQILAGVNLMAVGANGERVITNLLSALLPILEKGAQKCANEQVGTAVAQAKQNRAQRRAQR